MFMQKLSTWFVKINDSFTFFILFLVFEMYALWGAAFFGKSCFIFVGLAIMCFVSIYVILGNYLIDYYEKNVRHKK